MSNRQQRRSELRKNAKIQARKDEKINIMRILNKENKKKIMWI
ncbi:MAG: hypothetical protein PHR96_04435 [Clostridia bacterium]|nr:hypothetical protein [Clostridia bacterium]